MSAKLTNRKPRFFDRMDLWFSTGWKIDGLWIGTIEDKPWHGLSRIEEALRLIKENDPLHYSLVLKNLDRIWVRLIPSAEAHYSSSLRACVFDERLIRRETISTEAIASIIVHEATHARLESYGIAYEEGKRPRIEAICVRRERSFVSKLRQKETLNANIARSLEWLAEDHDYYSDASFRHRETEGELEILRFLGMPKWLVKFLTLVARRRGLLRSEQSKF
jgi:hypothetical protein